NGELKKITEKRGNSREPSGDGKARDDNKRPKTGRMFSTITNPVMKEYTDAASKCLNCSFHHNPEIPCRNVVVHTISKQHVRRLNRAPRPGGNRPNQVMAIEGGQGRGNNGNR
ncbi:hypothetical protein Tco_0419530, partial [Tanacetum coccineum]